MINLGVEEMIKQWIMENIPDFNTMELFLKRYIELYTKKTHT